MKVSAGSSRPWYETAFGPYYSLLYAHRDHEEARQCVDLLSRLSELGTGPVLDLGCGPGRHLQILTDRGFPSIGLDLSRPLLAVARRNVPAAPLVRADMRRLPFRDSGFGAVLSLFTSFGYFGAVSEHLLLVREIARVLRPGGRWFLDFLDSERVAAELADGPRERSRDLGVLRVHEHRRLAEAPRRVVKTVRLEAVPGRLDEARAVGIGRRGLRYVEEVTLLSMADLTSLTAAAGLRQVAAAGDYLGGPLIPGRSDRWLLVFDREE